MYMTEEIGNQIEVKKKRGEHGPNRRDAWQYTNKLTGETKMFGSVKALANELNVCQKTVYNIVNKRSCKNVFLNKVCDMFEITRIVKDNRGKHLLVKRE